MKKSLKGILILFLCLSVMVQLTGIWSLYLASKMTEINTAYAYAREAVEQSGRSMDDYLCRKTNKSLELSYNEQVKDYMLYNHGYRYKTHALIGQLLSNALYDDIVTHCRLDFRDKTGLGWSPMIHVADAFRVHYYSGVFKQLDSQQDKMINYLVWLTPIYSPVESDQFGGAMHVVFNLQKLMTTYFGEESCLLLDMEGELVENLTALPAEDVLDALEKGRQSVSWQGRDYLLHAYTSHETGLQFVQLREQALLLDSGLRYTDWAVVLSIVTIICGIVVALALYRRLLAPVEDIVGQIKVIGSSDNTLLVHDSHCSELMILTKGINHMILRLADHARVELDMRQALYDAKMRYVTERMLHLQSKINPHFLYNNLECIRGMAAAGEKQSIRTMCTAMAHIYRYGTRSEKLLTSLREEIECLKQYEQIIRLRYGEAYRFVYRMQEDTLDFALPRMTLQPLCENAILHGLMKNEPAEPRVWITSWMKGRQLVVSIEDNGGGMDEEKLRCMNEELQQKEEIAERRLHTDRIGVFNIQKRLIMLNGGESSMVLQNREGGGLRVVVTVFPTDYRGENRR